MRPLRRFLPGGLFGRSLLIVMVPLVLLQAVSAYIFYSRHWEDVGRRLALGLAGEIALLIDAVKADGSQVNASWLINRARLDMAVEAAFEPGVTLPDRPSHVFFGPVDQTLARVLPERISHPYQFDTHSNPDRVSIAVELATGVLTVSASRKRLFSSTIYVFILWMVGTSLVLLALAIYFLRRQIRPIRALAHAADSFGKGVLIADFKPYGATEVRQAARAFLRMRERIRRQLTQRTEMLAGVSHDLRTPLTRMRLQLEMDADAGAIAALKADVTDMERMIEGYLAFARGEDSEGTTEVTLADLLAEVAADAKRNDIALTLGGVPDGVMLALRRNAVKRALTNLIDNAARYGSRVDLAATLGQETLSITIDDDGPGIPAESREAVFKPFFRLDPSRNPDTGGVGLGLSIAADVMRNHGGDLRLEDAPLGGLRAHATLPI